MESSGGETGLGALRVRGLCFTVVVAGEERGKGGERREMERDERE